MRLLAATILLLMQVPVSADGERYRIFSSAAMLQGREIWMDNCEGCHGWGVADAPVPMQPDQWRARVDKPRTILYLHALEGFFGPDDSMMPARGGNPRLNDDEVRAAVDYMLALANFHLNQTR